TWNFHSAWAAPCRPKIQYDDLALKCRQTCADASRRDWCGWHRKRLRCRPSARKERHPAYHYGGEDDNGYAENRGLSPAFLRVVFHHSPSPNASTIPSLTSIGNTRCLEATPFSRNASPIVAAIRSKLPVASATTVGPDPLKASPK